MIAISSSLPLYFLSQCYKSSPHASLIRTFSMFVPLDLCVHQHAHLICIVSTPRLRGWVRSYVCVCVHVVTAQSIISQMT